MVAVIGDQPDLLRAWNLPARADTKGGDLGQDLEQLVRRTSVEEGVLELTSTRLILYDKSRVTALVSIPLFAIRVCKHRGRKLLIQKRVNEEDRLAEYKTNLLGALDQRSKRLESVMASKVNDQYAADAEAMLSAEIDDIKSELNALNKPTKEILDKVSDIAVYEFTIPKQFDGPHSSAQECRFWAEAIVMHDKHRPRYQDKFILNLLGMSLLAIGFILTIPIALIMQSIYYVLAGLTFFAFAYLCLRFAHFKREFLPLRERVR